MKDKGAPPEIPPELERYIALCRRMFDRMMETGEWPWEDEFPSDSKKLYGKDE